MPDKTEKDQETLTKAHPELFAAALAGACANPALLNPIDAVNHALNVARLATDAHASNVRAYPTAQDKAEEQERLKQQYALPPQQ